MEEITVKFLSAIFGFIFISFLISFGCGSKKKKTSSADSKKLKKKNGTPSIDDENEKGSAVSSVKKGGTSMQSGMNNVEDTKSLKPRSMAPQDVEEIETNKKITEGKMRAARDNETVDDAQSDWGAVKSMAERQDKEQTKEQTVEDEKPKKKKKK